MRISFINEMDNIRYGKTISVNRLIEKLREKGIEVFYNSNFDECDIIHAHTPFALTIYALKKYKDKPKIATIHSNPSGYRSFIPLKMVESMGWNYFRKVYSNFDCIISPTEYLKEVLIRHNIRNVEVISNGIDLKKFRRNREKGEEFKEKYNLDEFILSIGRINDPRKNFNTIKYVAKNIDFEFVHIGDYIPPISGINKMLGIRRFPENLHVLGYLGNEEIIGALSSSIIFIHPSFFETEGLSILEALSCETPVVARNLPVYENLLVNGFNSFLCNNREEFLDAISSLLKNEKLRRKFARRGREIVKSRDINKVVEKHILLYERILD